MRRKKDSGSELRLGCNDKMTVIGEAVWNPPRSRVCLTFMKGFDIAFLTLSKSHWTVFMNGISVGESRTINTSLMAVGFFLPR